MRRRLLMLVTASLTLAVPCGQGMAAPRNHAVDPLVTVARRHGWGAGQQADWRAVIYREDRTWSLTAADGSCYGIGQLQGGPAAYYRYGGSPWTELGQLTAMGNYIWQRYGTPAGALAHEQRDGWY